MSKPTDYAEHLIAARKALNAAEAAANAGDWQRMAHEAETATFHAIGIEQWADARLRDAA